MKKCNLKTGRLFAIALFAFSFLFTSQIKAQSFDQSALNFNGLTDISSGVTSLMYGPDGRLYVAEYPGTIKILTIQRAGDKNYVVTAVETLTSVKDIPNHDDDGTACSGDVNDCSSRETTGLTVGGTAANPVIYVSSSDFRVGAGNINQSSGNGDIDLDTNSGVITRLTWNGSNWDVVDIVRGLPRSEENHATNGLELGNINGTDYLFVASGGNTNGGAPSANFAYTCEYALSAAILAIDLDAIEAMSIKTDSGRNYIYDIPTLDDPTRSNVNGITDPNDPGYNGIDINDPWGGNDGLNMAMEDPTGPVQIYSPGFRNAYDIVLTESGALYATENGPNGGWGGFPVNEGTVNVNNNYNSSEPGSSTSSGGEIINNQDHLHLVTNNIQSYTFGAHYGGHPNPVRANPNGAGLYTAPETKGTNNAVFRTLTYDPDGSTPNSTNNPNIALPANWPPVPVANTVEGDYRDPENTNPDGADDDNILVWNTNTNGIDEYTASNFGGILQGDLVAGHNGGNVWRVELNTNGTVAGGDKTTLFSGISGDPLGITCNGDDEIFPGTIWVGTLGGTSSGNPSGGTILVYEPLDFLECTEPGEPGYDPNDDGDSDGYTNQDEEDNETDVCNGGSQPDDFDKAVGGTLVSNLNDLDDDADGINDAVDPFQLGDPQNSGSDAFELPIQNDLFNNQQGLGGIFGLGMTGLMNNGDTGANWMNWIDRRDDPSDPNPNDVLGGAPGIMTSHMTSGTALGATNTQEKAYQYGIQTSTATGTFTVAGGMNAFSGGLYRLYDGHIADGVGELGFYIGDGTQSNYIKFVVTTNGFTILQEINDIPGTPINLAIAQGNRPSDGIEFFFIVNPSNGEVEMLYEFDGNGSRVSVGTVTAQGSILTAIQNNSNDLAIGFIGTSGTVGKELEGSWDYLYAFTEVPFVSLEIPDVQKQIDAADQILDLDNYFNDNNGVGNLTYNVQSNTNTAIGTSVVGSNLTLTFPSTEQTSTITIRATDAENNFIDDAFTVTVVEEFLVLYRVNSGGPEVAAIDGGIVWEEDTAANNSAYLSVPGSNSESDFDGTIDTYDGSVDQSTTPTTIFDSERFDNANGTNMKYAFPVSEAGNYEVRIYMGNSFFGTSEPGERVFDVLIDGILLPELDDVDLSDRFGHETGGMISHIINVTDGILDVEFVHDVIENPIVNGIEVLRASDTETPIYVHPIANQTSNASEQLNGGFVVNAIGGDGNLNYQATGLPDGLAIEPTLGEILGTVSPSAVSGSPFNVTITVDDNDGLTSDQESIQFTWTVFEASSFRINAGGDEVATVDIGNVWEGNAVSGVQVGGNYEVNTGTVINLGGIEFDKKDASVPGYINETIFNQLFASERFDLAAAPEMEFQFNTVENGDYVVNLYFANTFEDANQIGDRVFDILIEGVTVENNIDLVETFGHEIAGMLSYSATVNDGVLNISFDHEVENPLVNAIEIFKVDTGNPTLSLNAIADQTSSIGINTSINTSASGGDPGESFSYYISGQPDGLTINQATGVISGSIESSAAAGGPLGNGIHQVVVTVMKPMSAPATQTFTWTIDADYTWTDKNEDESYTARHENSFVQAGNKFYLMGGRENAKTIDVYDYSSNSWTSIQNSAPFEFNHFQAIEYQGLIWVIGAFKDNAFPSETPAENIWMFNPASEEWIQGPEIPSARLRGGVGLAMYNDKFYLVGGNTNGHAGGYVDWFDEYDPATGNWTVLADAPRERDHFAAVIIGDKLYAAGGRLSGGTGGVFAPTIPEVDVYDFTNNTWSTLPSGQNIPTPRGGTSAVNFNGNLIVMGGEVENEVVYGETVNDALKITEQYDPTANEWERLPDMNYDRHGTQAIVSGSGVFIIAGSKIKGGSPQKNMEFLGEDNPVGTPSVESMLAVPETVVIADGENEDIGLSVADGNVGIFVESLSITGASASAFTIESGDLNEALLYPNSTHFVNISSDDTAVAKTANLNIAYNDGSFASVILTNDTNITFDVTNPGDQYNYEGDVINLQVEATSTNSVTYQATGLPPTLNLNTNTGVISGTIQDDQIIGGGGAFQEQGGIVAIETESGTLDGDWSITTVDGETGILGGKNYFGSGAAGNGGTIPYQITFTTPGIYRFNWNSYYSGPDGTEENDSWVRFPNNDDFIFFGYKTGGDTDAAINAALDSGNVVYPGGSSRDGQGLTLNGQSGNGYLKIYRSGGASEQYKWQALTGDNQAFRVFVKVITPGTYTMEISERSLGHAIDKVVLYRVNDPQSNAELEALPESSTGGSSSPGASANSPYNVELTVTESGSSDTETVNFMWYVGDQGDLIAVPEADVVEGTIPLNVQFTGDNSRDDVGVTSYAWDFGDTIGTSTEANPMYTFNVPGTYEVSLTVEDAGGNSDTKTISITANGAGIAPEAIATADVLLGNAPLEVTFTGSTSTDDIGVESYSWDFGDGVGTSTDADPTYTYDVLGTFQAVLTVTDIEGLMDTAEITIVVDEPPVAVASADINEGPAPLEVAFTGDASTDNVGITAYSWDFGDGVGVSTEANPTYTFDSPGTYTVTLTVSDENGAQDTTTVIIMANENEGPVAFINSDVQSGNAPLTVMFIGDESTDDKAVVSYEWNFGDGSEVVTEANPTHVFQEDGTYTVELTVTDEEGLSDSTTTTIVVDEGIPPVAVIAANMTEGDAPFTVVFDASGSTDDVAVVGYAWDFNNGGTSTDENPITTFEMPGTYTVMLTVSDNGGLTDSETITITVNDGGVAPVAEASAVASIGVTPFTASFIGSNSTDDVGIVSYAWDFGDGLGTSNEADPTYTYNFVGTYTATLTVTDINGLTDTATVTVQSTNPDGNNEPVAIITATPQTGETPLTVDFTGSNSIDDNGIVSYSWDFGDGIGTSTEADPSYVFNGVGEFEVSLTVFDQEGANDNATFTIVVIEANMPPSAAITTDVTSGVPPLTVNFDGSTSSDDNGIVSYLWNFGDGNTSTLMNPSYSYTETGQYVVSLTVEDEQGETNTTSVTISVNISDGDSEISVAPNPAGSGGTNPGYATIALQLPSGSVPTAIHLHDSAGRLIQTFNPAEIGDGQTYSLPVFNLRDELYFVKVELNNGEPMGIQLLVRK